MKLNVITRVVKNLGTSRKFYEQVLGFTPGPAYEPTCWQAYTGEDGARFAIGEAPGSTNEIAFAVDDVEAMWERVKDQVDVVEPLWKTPWGTDKFVVRDPDGHVLAFSQK